MTDRNVRRWRLVRCFRNENKTERESEAQRYVEQLKALTKGFKFNNPSLAEISVENSLGRDTFGNLRD